MYAEQIRRAITASPRTGLPALAEALWRSYAAGAIGEEDAQRLAEEIEARKVAGLIQMDETAPRRVGSRPRSSASLERRRAWTGSGWMPPAILARFTLGEAAAMSVVLAEVATRGRCEMPIGAIAGRAGVCATIVKRALRQARAIGLVAIEERRLSYARSLPNVVTVVSVELASWVSMRGRGLRRGSGGTFVSTTKVHTYSLSARPAATTRKAGTREQRSDRRPALRPAWPM